MRNPLWQNKSNSLNRLTLRSVCSLHGDLQTRSICWQSQREELQEVHRIPVLQDESTHATLFCNQSQNCLNQLVTTAIIIFLNLCMVPVLSIFWSLHTQVSATSPEVRGRSRFCNPGKISLRGPGCSVGLLSITRGYSVIPLLTSVPTDAYFENCITKSYHVGHPFLLLFSSGYIVSCSKVFALNNFIQCNDCQFEQLFQLKSLLIKFFTTILTKHIVCLCVRLSH